MNYLRLFEAFNKDDYWDNYLDELNTDLKKSKEDSVKDWSDYYKLLTQDEAHDWIVKMSDVTKEDFNLVVSSLNAITYTVSISKWGLICDDAKVENYDYIVAKRSGFEYKIFRLPDEWFLVAMCAQTNIFYLCDQQEGLVAFLKKTSAK
jgi:hypothetical protein